MSFLRHRESYQVRFLSELCGGAESWSTRARPLGHALTHRLDEPPVGYSLAGCSPAEPASASPTGGYSVTMAQWIASSHPLKYQIPP